MVTIYWKNEQITEERLLPIKKGLQILGGTAKTLYVNNTVVLMNPDKMERGEIEEFNKMASYAVGRELYGNIIVITRDDEID